MCGMHGVWCVCVCMLECACVVCVRVPAQDPLELELKAILCCVVWVLEAHVL